MPMQHKLNAGPAFATSPRKRKSMFTDVIIKSFNDLEQRKIKFSL